MSATDYDVIVIGAGPGGYVAAIRAAQLGLRTAVVEQAHLGGICLNWGCIPTKALLRSAEILHEVGEAATFGVMLPGAPKLDLKVMLERSRSVARELSNGVGFLLKKNGVDVIWGTAKLRGGGAIDVVAPAATGRKNPDPPKDARGAGRYTAAHIIIATGARPRALPGMEPDGKRIWTYFEAMLPPSLPRSLLIAGSGAIGIEFASFYRALGVEVTVVELLPEILPAEDAEIAALARKAFAKEGIRIITGAKVGAVQRDKDGITATVEHADGKRESIAAERLISAVGVVGNVEGLGLEALGVKLDRGLVARRRRRPHQRRRHLCHRRRSGGAHARPQGRARGRHLRRGHQGARRPPARQAARSRLHLQPPADRLGRSHRGARQGCRARGAHRPVSFSRQWQSAGARRA